MIIYNNNNHDDNKYPIYYDKNNNIIYYTLYTYIINSIRIWVARVPWKGQGPAGTHAPNGTSVAICTSGAWGGRCPIITLSLLHYY